MWDFPDIEGGPMRHREIECGTELGRQLNFENLHSKKWLASFRQRKYVYDIPWPTSPKFGKRQKRLPASERRVLYLPIPEEGSTVDLLVQVRTLKLYIKKMASFI